jgi:hypothetical protein
MIRRAGVEVWQKPFPTYVACAGWETRPRTEAQKKTRSIVNLRENASFSEVVAYLKMPE